MTMYSPLKYDGWVYLREGFTNSLLVLRPHDEVDTLVWATYVSSQPTEWSGARITAGKARSLFPKDALCVPSEFCQ